METKANRGHDVPSISWIRMIFYLLMERKLIDDGTLAA